MRLLKKLRLQMNCVAKEEVAWSRVLGVGLIRSLVGLRSLRLQINHSMDAAGYQWSKAREDEFSLCKIIQVRLGFVQRMKVLPLTEVEVFVGDYSERCREGWKGWTENAMWAAGDRTEYADVIRRILLDPKGAEKWAQDLEEWKEIYRRHTERTRERLALRAAIQRNPSDHDAARKLIDFDAGLDKKSDEI